MTIIVTKIAMKGTMKDTMKDTMIYITNISHDLRYVLIATNIAENILMTDNTEIIKRTEVTEGTEGTEGTENIDTVKEKDLIMNNM